MTPLTVAAPTILAAARTMRAALHRAYGRLEEGVAPMPVLAPGQVLVRVQAAHLTIGDHHVISGTPWLVRLSPYGGLPRPRHLVPGQCFSGVIEGVADGVEGFSVGDEVMGQDDHGAFSEYVVASAARVARKPKTLSLEESAAVPWGLTALQGLRDAGGVQAGQKVLIIGASGAVGSWAVQVAKGLGAEVTAVCSTRNVELVRGLGAAHVIDYTKEDYAAGGRFDVVFDLVGTRALSELAGVLVDGGTYVAGAVGDGDFFGPILRLATVALRGLFSSRVKLKTFLQVPSAPDLATLATLIDAGQAKPVIGQRFSLGQLLEALALVGSGHARGQTLLVLR